jgi:hypothetical protein
MKCMLRNNLLKVFAFKSRIIINKPMDSTIQIEQAGMLSKNT